jgi:hypothetical protein
MPTEYAIDKEVSNAVTDMLGDSLYTEFAPLRDNEVKIETCTLVRTNKDGEDMPAKDDPVTLKKVPQVEKLFVDVDYILIVDNSAWKTANSDKAQKAIIHRGLMKILVEPKDEGVKLATRKPDIVEFTETAMRFGAYNDRLLGFQEATAMASKRIAKELHK